MNGIISVWFSKPIHHRQFLFAIVLLTAVAYWPALHGGFIWDDDAFVTQNLTLRDLGGLQRIWFEVGAVPQYYPLVYTSFWLEYHLWGFNPLGYHVVNVLLHATGAILLGRILVRLQVPGAWLAAMFFALHPVQVESVAWITELKNVLSTVFYFAAALAYLRFTGLGHREGVGRRRWHWYFAALGLFLAALLSKTVTCSLPAALLLVLWWKNGRIRRSDVQPLLPFFATGIALGLLTAWMEKHFVGAQGAEWSLTFFQRCLIAGRAVWFYAGKLVWPAQLTFIYPRWTIDPGQWWQWVFPVFAVGGIATLWWVRQRVGRGPLVAVLFFAGTLGPALGFVNVYPMRYSFVADHFQYLASVGLLVLCAVGLSQLPRVAVGALLLMLGVLTWQQAGKYHDLETLWRDTLAKNPVCWMAHCNYGGVLARQGRTVEAVAEFNAALRIKPDYSEAHDNLGYALGQQGRLAEAMAEFRIALQIQPNNATAHNNLGDALTRHGRLTEAQAEFRIALQIKPDYAMAHNNLGIVLAHQGKVVEAINEFRAALQSKPDFVEARNNLDHMLANNGTTN